MSNFKFLKKNNESLFNIIANAEKLFTDEYFEQVPVQVRRFAENICRDLLQGNVLPDETLDSMINRLKDKSFDNIRMKEFADDLYFLKKHGNNSAHSSNTLNDGKIALECLERAYEVAVFYSNVKYGYNKKLDKSVFCEELLMTGEKSSTLTLKEIYSNKLQKTREKSKNILTEAPSKKQRQSQKNITKKTKNKSQMSVFNIVTTLLLISLAIAYVYSHIKSLF